MVVDGMIHQDQTEEVMTYPVSAASSLLEAGWPMRYSDDDERI